MTDTTLCRRSFEHASNMTVGTIGIFVSAFKRKPGQEVIKTDGAALRTGLWAEKHCDSANQHQDYTCP
jgi:hypothetical protein